MTLITLASYFQAFWKNLKYSLVAIDISISINYLINSFKVNCAWLVPFILAFSTPSTSSKSPLCAWDTKPFLCVQENITRVKIKPNYDINIDNIDVDKNGLASPYLGYHGKMYT